MGTVERRAREKANLQRAILDAARDLFATQGYEAVSMRKIAERIEYSPTAIYLYFKDKDAILAHLIDEGFTMLSAAVRESEAAHPISDPVERLRSRGQRYVAFALENPHYYTLMFQLTENSGEDPLRHHCESGELAFNCIRECIREGQTTGQFRQEVPEPILSHIAWAHLHGAIALTLSGRMAMLPREHLSLFFDSVIEATLRGLQA